MANRWLLMLPVTAALLSAGYVVGRASVDGGVSEPTPLPEAPPPASSTPASTAAASTAPVDSSDFVVTFDGNTGLERFDYGLWHRDDVLVSDQTWTGDHDLDCGTPDTQRTITRDRWQDSFYMCRDHMMTAVGATSGYSIAWFTPKQAFDADHTEVSWDVNVTDLKNRQWWEVMIYPASDAVRYVKAAGSVDGTDCAVCTSEDFVAKVADLKGYGPGSIVVGNGPYGTMQPNIHYNDVDMYGGGFTTTCSGHFTWFKDSGACDSKKTRLTFTITDDQNGTITVDYGGAFTETFSGAFPDEPWRVVFKDHSYTPDKDGAPAGHTWHWDTIGIT